MRDTEMSSIKRDKLSAADADLGTKLLPDGEPGGENSTASSSAKAPTKAVKFSEIFRYMDGWDKVLLMASLLSAAANGAAFPSFTFIFSGMLNALYSPDVIDKVRMLFGSALIHPVIGAVGSAAYVLQPTLMTVALYYKYR